MVEIPVEKKKGGLSWVVWLLLLAAIAVAAWYLFASPEGRRLREDATTATVAPGEAYTSLDQIAANPAGSAGQPITLTGVQVVSTVGSGGLLIADDSGSRIFVASAEAPSFAAGSRVNIMGTIQAGEEGGEGEASRPVGMPPDTSHYIVADQITAA